MRWSPNSRRLVGGILEGMGVDEVRVGSSAMARSNIEHRRELVVLEVVQHIEPAQHAFVGVEALGPLAPPTAQLRFLHLRCDRCHHPDAEFVLQLEQLNSSAASPEKRSLRMAVPLSQSASSANSRTLLPARRTLPDSM